LSFIATAGLLYAGIRFGNGARIIAFSTAAFKPSEKYPPINGFGRVCRGAKPGVISHLR
jgi:hypothetical protein